MKSELEPSDVELIAQKVLEYLLPHLNSREEDEILDKRALAEYLQVDTSWIDKSMYMLPRFKLGKYVRFKKSHIDRWIENNKKTPSPFSKMVR